MKKRIGYGLIALLVLIQFIPALPESDVETTSESFADIYNPRFEVESILKNACYDCHSNYVRWPWYSKVAPVSFWIGHHVEEGREHLNFAEWGSYSQKKANHKLEEIIEELKEGEMPLTSYTITHAAARLSDEEKLIILDFISTIRE